MSFQTCPHPRLSVHFIFISVVCILLVLVGLPIPRPAAQAAAPRYQDRSAIIANPQVAVTPEPGTPAGPVPGFTVKVRQSAGTPVSDLGVARELLAGNIPAAFTAFDTGIGVINYSDFFDTPASTGNFGSNRDFRAIPGNGFGSPAYQKNPLRPTGYQFIPTARSWTIAINSDDGCRLLMGATNSVIIDYPGPKGPGALTGTAEIPVPGYYRFTLEYFEFGGGAEVEFFANGPGQPADRLVGDPSGTLQVVHSGIPQITPLTGVVPPNPGFAVKIAQSAASLTFNLGQALLDGTAPALFTAYDSGVGTINYTDVISNPSPAANFGNDRDIRLIPGNEFGSGNQENYALRAAGAILIPTAGNWTFTINSDDGCRLTMGANQEVVVNAPFSQASTDRSGTVGVLAPGYYPFQLEYYEGGGGSEVEFFATGPGQPTNLLVGDPAGTLRVFHTALSGVTPAAGHVVGDPGFAVKVSQQATFLNLNSAISLLDGTAPALFTAFDDGVETINYVDIAFSSIPAGNFGNDRDIRLIPANGFGPGNQDNYAIRATGVLLIPTSGTWTFTVNQDDGCRFLLGATPVTVLNEPFYQSGMNRSRSIDIPAPGFYPFQFDYYENGGGSYVELSASGPGQPTRLLVGDPAGTLRVFQRSSAGVQTNRLFAADMLNHRIQRFENGGWTLVGGQFTAPKAVTANLAGTRIYVADTGADKIQYSTNSGATWADLTTSGQVSGPQGLALDPAGNLYVADTNGNRVLRFTGGVPSPTPVVLAGPGNGVGQVNSPRGLAIAPNGRLLIADKGNNRIWQLPNAHATPGTPMQVAGKGSGAMPLGQVTAPEGVALDNAGNLYVADTGNNRVLRFAGGNGGPATVLCSLSVSLTAPPLGQVRGAEGVAVCDASVIGGTPGAAALIVADTQNNRVQGTLLGSNNWNLVGTPNGMGTGVGQFRAPSKIR